MLLDDTVTLNDAAHTASHAELRAAYLARGNASLPVYTGYGSVHAAIHNALHTEHNALGAPTTLSTSITESTTTGHLAAHSALHAAHNARQAVTGTTYYVSAVGSNANNGTSSATPWATIAKVNSTTLVAGDTVLFRKGDTFTDAGLVCDNNGTSVNRITYGAYGTGALPIISGGGTDTTVGTRTPVRVDANYVTVDSLCTKWSSYAGIDLYGTDARVTNCLITRNATGLQANGAAARAFVDHNAFDTNNIIIVGPGTNDDYGAQGLALGSANAEVSYNTFLNHYNTGSPDYGVDGAAIEVFGATNANVHHNSSVGDLIFAELGADATDGCVFHHNVMYSTRAAAGGINVHGVGSFGGVTGTKFLHNTIVLTATDSVGLAIDGTVDLELRNNIFQVSGGMYSVSTVALTEQGNVISGTAWIDMKGGSTVDATSTTTAAGLVAPATGNYHLSSGTSSAVNRGVTTSVTFTADYDGVAKQGANWDAGALEYV